MKSSLPLQRGLVGRRGDKFIESSGGGKQSELIFLNWSLVLRTLAFDWIKNENAIHIAYMDSDYVKNRKR